MHYLELPMLERSIPSEGGLINWLLFLKGADTSQWEVLKMNEPGLEKAMDTLQYLSQDSDARRLYEARQKYLHDEASMLGSAEMAGIKKGKIEVAQNLLAMGMDHAAVAKATGLSEDEVRSIRF
ncbi:Rpn family recombination-promoting nuclease/putative transposase [Paenibacillus sp. FSL H8-0332]|uniref:Rpn family recombination-promoting nuclease/putative transposase n=1 Tax=Paenibacillus sp. FSL H8-0332 TaxID=2954742 RepID=UPI0030D1391D